MIARTTPYINLLSLKEVISFMLNFLEYRVLKEYSKYPNNYIVQPESQSHLDRVRFINRKNDLQIKTKIKWFLIETITDKFIDAGYLYLSADISPLGLTEVDLFWKNWFKKLFENICKVYLPLIISLIAITLSLISFFSTISK